MLLDLAMVKMLSKILFTDMHITNTLMPALKMLQSRKRDRNAIYHAKTPWGIIQGVNATNAYINEPFNFSQQPKNQTPKKEKYTPRSTRCERK
jgi:hypothetical protein